MKNKILFLKRLFLNAALGALLTSSVFAMDEDREKPAASAFSKLNVEQNTFIVNLHDGIVLELKNQFRAMMIGCQSLSAISQEADAFYIYYKQVHPSVLKINKILKEKFTEIEKYYTENKAPIGTLVNGETYLKSLNGALKKMFEEFSKESSRFIELNRGNPKEITRKFQVETPRLQAGFSGILGQFFIGDKKSLEAHFFGMEAVSEEKMTPKGVEVSLAGPAKQDDVLIAQQERFKVFEIRLKILTTRIDGLIAHRKEGRDEDGYSMDKEGIMKLGNHGGLNLLGDVRQLLSSLFEIRNLPYIDPYEGAALGFSNEDALTFYRALISEGHLDVSEAIADSFDEETLRFCNEKSKGTFEPLFKKYVTSKTRENINNLAEAILKLSVAESHSTRLLHPLALAKSLWDQKPGLKEALIEILPSYFMLMADQVGKCANGATGRTILMTRLLAEALTKAPLN